MAGVWDTLATAIHSRELTRCGRSWAGEGRRLICDPFSRMYWIKRGEAFIEHDGQTHRIRRGQLHVIPAHSTGRYRCSGRMDLYWCHFNATVLGGIEIFGYAKCALDIRLPARSFAETDALWEKFVSLGGDSRPSARIESAALLSSLLAKMMETADSSHMERMDAAHERFAPVFDCIEKRLSRKIKVSELAELVHLQENYFTGLFKSHFGIPPMSYLKLQRVRKAQLLLRSGGIPLKRIAEECGFGSPFHFSMAFKSVAGVPPGEFRKRSAERIP